MDEDNFKMVQDCFREARITDELRLGSIKKYGSSIKNFLELLGPKNLADLNNREFDQHILEMKGRGAGNAHTVNVIAAMKWLTVRLREKGISYPPLIFSPQGSPKPSKMRLTILPTAK